MFDRAGRTRFLSIAAALVFCLGPYVLVPVLSAVRNWRFPHLLPTAWQPGRWHHFLVSSAIMDSIWLSVVISLLVTLVATPLGFLAARFVAYHPRREQLLITAYAPYVFSPVILATVLLYVYLKLDWVGSIGGVLAVQIMFASGFALLFFVPFWNERKRQLESLVYTLGGSKRQAFTHVLLPLFREPLLICAFQTFLISWTQYGTTLLIGAGKIQTLPLKVYDFVYEANPQYAAMAATLLIVPPALLIWFNRKLAGIEHQSSV